MRFLLTLVLVFSTVLALNSNSEPWRRWIFNNYGFDSIYGPSTSDDYLIEMSSSTGPFMQLNLKTLKHSSSSDPSNEISKPWTHIPKNQVLLDKKKSRNEFTMEAIDSSDSSRVNKSLGPVVQSQNLSVAISLGGGNNKKEINVPFNISSQPAKLSELLQSEHMSRGLLGKPTDIRRHFDEHDINIDLLAALGRIKHFMTMNHINVSNTKCPKREILCNEEGKYRTFDGLCNNLRHPEWGAYLSPVQRLIKPHYENGVWMPRGAVYIKNVGYKSILPNPRKISVQIHKDVDKESDSITHMLMQFGQFLDHDIVKTTKDDDFSIKGDKGGNVLRRTDLECCHEKLAQTDRCFNIDLREDAFYQKFQRKCMDFTRSNCHCHFTKWREQFNGVTSFIDCSNIYGSSVARNLLLRGGDEKRKNGLLVKNKDLPHFIPTRKQLGMNLIGHSHFHDFISGDGRANIQSSLLSIHILWFREHNRVARLLAKAIRKKISHLHPKDQDELIFQETRKIIIAEMQNVVYKEYLPALFSPRTLEKYNLSLQKNSAHDSNINPTILNEFATAAFRFGHSTVQSVFHGIDQPWRLGDFYADPIFAVHGNGSGFEREIAGACKQLSQKCDRFISKELTQKLFLNKKMKNVSNFEGLGFDLAALNIQRGRDHGLPDYNTMRSYYNLSTVTFKDRPPQFDENVWDILRKIYKKADDIDLYTAGLAEKNTDDLMGPTFAQIIAEQFFRLKTGDRYFFTHKSGGLHDVIQNMIMKRNFGDIICDNTNHIMTLQRNVFFRPTSDSQNPPIQCGAPERSKLDFNTIGKHINIIFSKPNKVKIVLE